MRIIALDIGDVRIGVAVSDLMRIIANPRETYVRKDEDSDIAYFIDLAKKAIDKIPDGGLISKAMKTLLDVIKDTLPRTLENGKKWNNRNELALILAVYSERAEQGNEDAQNIAVHLENLMECDTVVDWNYDRSNPE